MKGDMVQKAQVGKAGKFGRIPRSQVVILIVAWLVSLGVGYQAYRSVASPAEVAIQGTPVPVRRGTLAATVNAAGSVVSTRQAKLTFGVAGKIVEVHVELGDTVKAGQPMAKLDTSQLEIKLAQAQSTLRSAELKQQQLKAGASAEDVAAAKAAYESALAKYSDLARGPTDSEIKAAEQAVANAQAALQKAETELSTLKAGPDADQVRLAELELERARNSLWATQIDRDGIKGNPLIPDYQKNAADARVAAAETAVTQARVNLEIKKKGPTPEQISAAEKNASSARAALQAAEAKLAELRAKPNQPDLLAAQSALASARAQLALKTRGATAEELALGEEAIKQAQAAVQQAELDLKNAVITAPFDGVVGSVGASVGEQISAGAAMFTLVDPKAVRVDVSVAEIDVGKVAVGKPAQVTFDALPGQRLPGKVVAIGPTATVQQGVVSYLVSIAVEAEDVSLPPGLTASASIIFDQKDGALMVPNRAVRTEGRNRVVEVLVGDKTETRPIQIGMSNEQFTEVVDGLSEGEQVVIKPTSSTMPRMMGNPGAMRLPR